MKKCAGIYKRKKQFFIHASSKTTAHWWIIWEPILALPETCDDQELDQAIRTALEGSRVDVPHPRPEDFETVGAGLYLLAGVKSWQGFANGASSVDVEQEGTRISLSPLRKDGAGFGPDDWRQVVVLDASSELGAAVRKLLP